RRPGRGDGADARADHDLPRGPARHPAPDEAAPRLTEAGRDGPTDGPACTAPSRSGVTSLATRSLLARPRRLLGRPGALRRRPLAGRTLRLPRQARARRRAAPLLRERLLGAPRPRRRGLLFAAAALAPLEVA